MMSRYVFFPMTAKRIGRRVTLLDMIRRRKAIKRQMKADVFTVCGFNQPVFPGK